MPFVDSGLRTNSFSQHEEFTHICARCWYPNGKHYDGGKCYDEGLLDSKNQALYIKEYSNEYYPPGSDNYNRLVFSAVGHHPSDEQIKSSIQNIKEIFEHES